SLARRELAAGREDAGYVARIVLEVRSVVELHQVTGVQRARVLVVVRIPSVFPRRDQSKIGRAIRPVFLVDVLCVGLQFVLFHTRAGIAHGFDDAEPGDARSFADDGDLARTLDGAQLVQNRIQILDFGFGRGGFHVRNESLLARAAAVPGVVPGGTGQGRRIAGGGG